MIKADELHQEISNKGLSISDINKTIRELKSIKNTITDSFEYKLFDGKVSEFVEAFNMFKEFYSKDSNEYIRKTGSKNTDAKRLTANNEI